MKKTTWFLFIGAAAFATICSFSSSLAGISRGGERNTNAGNMALHNNTSGSDNTALGDSALYSNTERNFHTAVGSQALFNNSGTADNTGNTAVGYQTLFSNTIGDANNAFGGQSMLNNIDGTRNCAVGQATLQNLTSGDSNTAVGNASLLNSAVINYNTAVGRRALFRSQADLNTAIGFFAGSNARGGSTNDVYVGNVGPDPIGSESNTIRIGQQAPATITLGTPPVTESHTFPAHTDTYVAGIFGSSTITPGMPVYVDASGKLGTLPSSARFKEDVKPMDNASAEIFALKPVTFRYKAEVTKDKAAQFGLVAEEVAKIDPGLVVRDAKGEIQSVRYEAVNAMLLNEFIKQHRQVEEQQMQIDKLTAQLNEQAALIEKVTARIERDRPAPRTVASRK
jgi:hypothetical protein